MEGFGGLFGDPDELQRRMAEFAESLQGQQKLAWADNAIQLGARRARVCSRAGRAGA
jgi:hypothetical protein